jgi:molybdate transport system substrate-binding protein
MNSTSWKRTRRAVSLVLTSLALCAMPLSAEPSFAASKPGTSKPPSTTQPSAQQTGVKQSTAKPQSTAKNTATRPPQKPSTTTGAPAINAPTTITPVAEGKAVEELLVAGASDLRPAFEEIGKLFTAQTGSKVTFSFGSSGQLAQQISNGAPFDVFASADKSYIDQVLADGIGDAATKATYAFGRLALWVPSRTQKRIFNVLDLSDPSTKRIAIANPEHAPYGVAAVQALKSAKIYELVADRLVYGENVSDTYRLATSGNADAALVSLSLVIANNNGGQYIIVPTDAHVPLEQALVVTAKKSRASSAKAFVAMVSSAAGRTVMRKYGFLLPGDPKPLNNNG